MNVRYFLFLSLGLTRVYPPQKLKNAKKIPEKLLEPDGAKVCRRNILALAGVVVIAGFAGADPREISVFGVKPSGDWGVIVLGMAVILAHLYWYALRYHHLNEDGVIEVNPALSGHGADNLKISGSRFTLVRKGADLFSNCAAFVLTCLSWCFVASWIIGKLCL
ncbi:MAG: hypothetical protein OXN97_19480 [Bryobacterales bacterium]|nr:hypothetical protein [Bryobacterales bacterium]